MGAANDDEAGAGTLDDGEDGKFAPVGGVETIDDDDGTAEAVDDEGGAFATADDVVDGVLDI